MSTDAYDSALALAVRLLAQRDYSSHELQQRLTQRGHDAQSVAAVLAECQRRGWQDDARYAERFASQRAQQGYGQQRIAAELRQRGVVDSMAEQVLDSLEWDWLAALKEQAERRVGRGGFKVLERTARLKLARALQQRGFAVDAIRRLILN